MSIQRTSSSSETARSRDADPSQRAQTREPPRAELVDRFKALMQAREGGTTSERKAVDARLAAQADAPGADAEASSASPHPADAYLRLRERDEQVTDGDRMPSAEMSSLLQAQTAARDAPVLAQAAPAPQANATALAALIERHVRQLAASDRATAASDGQVLLRLSDDTLPGTDLLLTRTPDGWHLRADVRSRESFDAIRDAAPQLAQRFAERNLGALSVDPHYHG